MLVLGAWRSPASVLAWGARGRRFKSFRPDKKTTSLLVWSFFSELLILGAIFGSSQSSVPLQISYSKMDALKVLILWV